jgi:hypothetical protein
MREHDAGPLEQTTFFQDTADASAALRARPPLGSKGGTVELLETLNNA